LHREVLARPSLQGESEVELKAPAHRLQLAPLRTSGAAEQSEDSPATASLARLLLVRVLVKDEAQRSEANRESKNLRLRRLAARAPVKRELEEREGKAPMVNLADRQEAGRLLQLSRGKGNQSAERKRERALHRLQGHDDFSVTVLAALEKFSGPLLCPFSVDPGRLAQAPLQEFCNLDRV
jgi:hypothetical protein